MPGSDVLVRIALGVAAIGAVLLVLRWGFASRKRLGEVLAWLEHAQREQEGRARHDAEMRKSSGKLGKRVRERVAGRVRDPKR